MKNILNLLSGLILGILISVNFLFVSESTNTSEKLSKASDLIGLEFTVSEIDSMAPVVDNRKESYSKVRKLRLPNSTPPALFFNPVPVGRQFDKSQQPLVWGYASKIYPCPMNSPGWLFIPSDDPSSDQKPENIGN
ncbi:MAG: hypothetical protein U5K69_24200 [Balneolaceae bacterium]|nr:hypothetical protein [Balneolaceae bacterium]